MSNFSVGVCILNLHIPQSRSLKAKRGIIQSLKNKIRNQFPVSVAEVGDNDLWQRVDLAIAQINGSSLVIDKTFDNLIKFIESNHSVTIVDYKIELF